MVDITKKWEKIRADYVRYLKVERRLSANTVEAYKRDLEEFSHFILRTYDVLPVHVERPMIERFMAWLYSRNSSAASQARRLSGVKSFYNYLLINDKIEQLPTDNEKTLASTAHSPMCSRLRRLMPCWRHST